MSPIFPGRYTAQIEGPFVVFIIGLRVNRLWALHQWLPVARAMGPMMRELLASPVLGLLSAHTILSWRGVGLVHYWPFIRSSGELFEESERLPPGSLEAFQPGGRCQWQRGHLARNLSGGGRPL